MPYVLLSAFVLQTIGKYQSSMNQAQAEMNNAAFYDQQANFARQTQFRQAEITDQEYSARKGAQTSAYAGGNVDISGSAANTLAATAANQISELNAIQRKGDLDYQFAAGRANQARNDAASLSNPLNLLMGVAATGAQDYAMYAGSKGGSTALTSGGTSANNLGWISPSRRSMST